MEAWDPPLFTVPVERPFEGRGISTFLQGNVTLTHWSSYPGVSLKILQSSTDGQLQATCVRVCVCVCVRVCVCNV